MRSEIATPGTSTATLNQPGSVADARDTVRELPDPGPDLPGELIDALIDVVVRPVEPGARSGVICSMVQEMCDAVEWLHHDDNRMSSAADEQGQRELVSIRQLAAAAEAHRSRMTAGSATWAGLPTNEPA